MALTAFPEISKIVNIEPYPGWGWASVDYAYVYVPASSQKTTFVLFHGFPSSSYDWRHQIRDLTAAGYGVLAPDLRGYGDTEKPVEFWHWFKNPYIMKPMCGHLMKILEHESLRRDLIAVGHGLGCSMVSRLASYFPWGFKACVFISAGYTEPGPAFDIDAINAAAEKAFGYPTFGYLKWFAMDEAADMLDQNPKSATSLFYPQDPELWRTHLCPIGSAEAWISAGNCTDLPDWLSEEEAAMHDRIMKKSGYEHPLHWYKAAMRAKNVKNEGGFYPDEKKIKMPTMLVVSTRDYATRADVQIAQTKEWVEDLRVETLDCGHWIQLEKRDELTGLLKEFANEVGGKEHGRYRHKFDG